MGKPAPKIACEPIGRPERYTFVASTIAQETATMSLGTVLLIILILALLGVLPLWPYSSGFGYYPSSGVGIVVVIVVVLLLLGRL